MEAARIRSRRRVLASALALTVIVGMLGACGDTPEGRVDPGSGIAGDGGGPLPIQAPSTEAGPTTTSLPPGLPAANRDNLCRGRADSFLPDQVEGFTVVGSGDASGFLPPGASGVQSAGATALRRQSDNSQVVVLAILFDETKAASPLVQSTIDLLLTTVGGEAGLVDAHVNGYAAKVGTGKDGTSVVLWQECLNVFELVQAGDEQTARDVAAKVHSP